MTEIRLSCFVSEPQDELVSDVVGESVKDFVNRAKLVANSVSTSHKELHGSVSKLGKCIDRVSTVTPVTTF